MDFSAEWVGALAAALTTGSYFPQVIKVLREKRTRDISLYMYVALTLGILLWCLYGVMIGSWSVMIGNGIAFLCAAFILAMKRRYG